MNLTPRAADALESATRRAGQNKTDAINRALVVWLLVLGAVERNGGQRLTIVQPGGELEHVYFL